MEALKDRNIFDGESKQAREESQLYRKKLDKCQKNLADTKEESSMLKEQLKEARELLSGSTTPDVARLQRLQRELDQERAARAEAEQQVKSRDKDLEYVKDAYQNSSSAFLELQRENEELAKQLAEAQRTADANVVEVNREHARAETRELARLADEARARERELQADLARAREELRRINNGRRETRQMSVPRSPHIGGGLGTLSPRGSAGRAGVASAASRGVSPAAPGGGGGGYDTVGGHVGMSMQRLKQLRE
jgi:chromosome segregation ATPase